MIKKGYHYLVTCDAPDCPESYVVGVARHSFEAKRQAKQKVIKLGWTMGEVGTTECPSCNKKRSEENMKVLAQAMEEKSDES
jgi:hypothetical protein